MPPIVVFALEGRALPAIAFRSSHKPHQGSVLQAPSGVVVADPPRQADAQFGTSFERVEIDALVPIATDVR